MPISGTKRTKIEQLLLDLYREPGQLRQDLKRLPDGDRVNACIPAEKVSMKAIIDAAIEELERRGLLYSDFPKQLLSEFRNRRKEIKGAFGLPDAAELWTLGRISESVQRIEDAFMRNFTRRLWMGVTHLASHPSIAILIEQSVAPRCQDYLIEACARVGLIPTTRLFCAESGLDVAMGVPQGTWAVLVVLNNALDAGHSETLRAVELFGRRNPSLPIITAGDGPPAEDNRFAYAAMTTDAGEWANSLFRAIFEAAQQRAIVHSTTRGITALTLSTLMVVMTVIAWFLGAAMQEHELATVDMKVSTSAADLAILSIQTNFLGQPNKDTVVLVPAMGQGASRTIIWDDYSETRIALSPPDTMLGVADFHLSKIDFIDAVLHFEKKKGAICTASMSDPANPNSLFDQKWMPWSLKAGEADWVRRNRLRFLNTVDPAVFDVDQAKRDSFFGAFWAELEDLGEALQMDPGVPERIGLAVVTGSNLAVGIQRRTPIRFPGNSQMIARFAERSVADVGIGSSTYIIMVMEGDRVSISQKYGLGPVGPQFANGVSRVVTVELEALSHAPTTRNCAFTRRLLRSPLVTEANSAGGAGRPNQP